MKTMFRFWRQPSEFLSQDILNDWLQYANVLESDPSGIKVIQLKDGRILKFFRVKRLLSSAQLFPYSKSFCRNAKRLNYLNIPTVKIIKHYSLANRKLSAELYQPLEGISARQLMLAQKLTQAHCEALGQFIADLHDNGIYFRGLHLGNIILMPDNRFGLIDIAEMSIYPWCLGCKRRFRNFDRFWRDFEDKFLFGYDSIHALIKGYHASCKKVDIKLKEIEKRLM